MRRQATRAACCSLAALALAACGGSDPGEPGPRKGLPSQIDMVASEGFESPLDAVASPDGSTFYFTAFTVDTREAAVFSVPAAGGEVRALHAGAPLSLPTGLVMSCDGATLVVADAGIAGLDDDDDEALADSGALYSLDVESGTLTALDAASIDTPSGLALSDDCQTLYVTGRDGDGMPALFRLPIGGGAVQTVYAGDPLISPTGMYVDPQEVAWVLDHVAGEDGDGVLYAITEQGELSAVLEGLALGAVGGCSLDAAGGTAFMPTHDEGEPAQLTTIALADASQAVVETPDIIGPAGLRTARDAAIFVLVDHEGNAIYSAQ